MNLLGARKNSSLGHSCGDPPASPVKKKRGNSFTEEEEKLGCTVKSKVHWRKSLRYFRQGEIFLPPKVVYVTSFQRCKKRSLPVGSILMLCSTYMRAPLLASQLCFSAVSLANIHKSSLSMWTSLNIHSHLQERDSKDIRNSDVLVGLREQWVSLHGDQEASWHFHGETSNASIFSTYSCKGWNYQAIIQHSSFGFPDRNGPSRHIAMKKQMQMS